MEVKLIMARTRSMSNTSSKAVPVLPAKCTREERRVLYQEAREEVKFLLDNLGDMVDSDDNDVGGSSLCLGDMVCLEDVMEAEEAGEDRKAIGGSRGYPLLPSRGYKLGDYAESLHFFNCHGMFRWPHSDKRRVKGEMSDLENCLKLKRERDDQE